MTEPPGSQTYASVVSRESVRIGLTIAALNGLDVLTADIQNAYLNAPCEEKIWTTCEPEFGEARRGLQAIIVRALYGLKSAGASFQNLLADCLGHLGYVSCKADPDVWLRETTRPDGFECYEYLLIYTDAIMAIGLDNQTCLSHINKYFKLKDGSIQPPDIYLGAKIKKTALKNGGLCWGQSASGYLQETVQNVEAWLDEYDLKLPTRTGTPMSASYRLELDVTPLLNDETANYFQSLIGSLRWGVELGRIDIATEISLLAGHLAMPRSGHLYAAFRVFAYLKTHHNSRIVFDPTTPDIDYTIFKDNDWEKFYGDIRESIPGNAPAPRGNPVTLYACTWMRTTLGTRSLGGRERDTSSTCKRLQWIGTRKIRGLLRVQALHRNSRR
jgi:hypothetical protein